MDVHNPPSPAIIGDRSRFLWALQRCVPDFWHGFHQGALGNPERDPRLSRENCEAYAFSWGSSTGIRDRWLFQVLQDTLTRWIEQPRHGGSQLQPGYQWFVYAEGIPILGFTPTFEDPYPLFTGRTIKDGLNTACDPPTRLEIAKSKRLETNKEFADRMTKQFRKQLAVHLKYLRHVSPRDDNRTQRLDHAKWTALVFTRQMTVGEIAEKWLGLGRYHDSYSAVSKAVTRFAADIGLTLPRNWTRT